MRPGRCWRGARLRLGVGQTWFASGRVLGCDLCARALPLPRLEHESFGVVLMVLLVLEHWAGGRRKLFARPLTAPKLVLGPG